VSAARTLVADGFYNARDLGGLPLVSGGATPRGVVFRSENPGLLTAAGWESVRDAGIRTVIDLRQPSEIERDASPRPAWLDVVEFDLDHLSDAEFWADWWDNGLVGTALYYLPFLRRMPERVGEILRLIARAEPGGVLFHCAGGRDRTGIVALALLTIAGVSPEAVVDDYLETMRNVPSLSAASGRPSDEDRIEALCAAHGTTNADSFRAALAGFDVDTFVASSGLAASDLAALRTWRGALGSASGPGTVD
jgi:protein-tyrosine phosphatase